MKPLRCLLGIGLAASTANAMAVTSPSDFCDETGLVHAERLALAALSEAGVSAYPIRWVTQNGGGTSFGLALLGTEGFCSQSPASQAGIPRCGKDDADKIADAQNIIVAVLRDQAHYVVPASIRSPADLFQPGASRLTCRAGAVAEVDRPAQIPPPINFKTVPVRLRGSTDGLQFDRNLDAAFAGVDKASVAFADDEAKGKKTFKAAAILGAVIRAKPGALELVPYVGFSTDTTKKVDEEKEIAERSFRTGLLIDLRSHGAGVSHLFSVRPEYAWNRTEKSQLLSLATIYTPVINGRLNDAVNITSRGRSLFSIIPRGDIRLIGGHFTRQGERPDDTAQDFLRLGPQVGVTLTSDIKWLPIELSVTETYLRAIKGEPNHLSYLKGVFSIYFDEKKYFGFDLGYARGRRSDLLDRESSWTAGFGAKF